MTSLLMLTGTPALAAVVPGPGGIIVTNPGIPGLVVTGLTPSTTGPLYEHVLEKNRLLGGIVFKNDSGGPVTFSHGTAFYLNADGQLMGTSAISKDEFGARVSVGSGVGFDSGAFAMHVMDADEANETPAAVFFDGNDRILTAGRAVSNGVDQVYLSRLNPDGRLDTTFSGDGRVLGPLGTCTGGFLWFNQPHLVGESGEPGNPTTFVSRFTESGSLNAGYGNGGVASVPPEIGKVFHPRAARADLFGRVA
ncbi:MAG: hypothetical protein KDM81_09290, partial [Verrucomicrobiae bacterium]|nr:hypothetical protein [Verrucomicrobiae bacterium]